MGCDAEPKDGQFPIWAPGGCANICLCTVGFGCYQFGSDPPETKNNCDCGMTKEECDAEPTQAPVFTEPPTTFVPTEETAMGCYVSQSVRDAGYQLGACDCEMTEAECNAEPKTEQGQFPIWSDEC